MGATTGSDAVDLQGLAMRSRWLGRFLILSVFLCLGGLYYYTAVWRHRVIIEDWHTSPVYTLPDRGGHPELAREQPLPALEPGELFLIVRVRRRMNDMRTDRSHILLRLPDGNTVEPIADPNERRENNGDRVIEVAFVVRQDDLDSGKLRLHYPGEDPVELSTKPADR